MTAEFVLVNLELQLHRQKKRVEGMCLYGDSTESRQNYKFQMLTHFHTGMQLASATQVEAEPFPGVSSAFYVCFSRRSKSNPAEPTWPFNLNKNDMKVHMND